MTSIKSRRPRLAPVAGRLSLALLAFCLPEALQSQASSGGRNVTVAYTPGSRTQNGYADAQQLVTYFIRECANDVAFLARYEATVRMLIAPHRYWVDGREVRVPSQFAAPAAPKPTLRGVIRGQNLNRSIEYLWASTDPSCWTNNLPLGPKAGFWDGAATEAQKITVLNSIGFDQQGTLPALRNTAVEAHFRAIFARERADSAARATAARSDSLARAQAARTAERTAQAQRDSLARAETARRQAAAKSAATTATATGAAGTSGSSAAGNAQSTANADAQRAAEERQRQEAADARQRQAVAEQRAADAEHARVTAAHEREMQIRDSIAIEQTAESTAQLAMLLGAGVGRVLDGLDGTGLAWGVSWNAPFFAGDGSRIGLTTTGHIDGYMAPFMELSFPLGGRDLGTEYAKGMSFTVGSVIPNTTFTNALGSFQPHVGMTFLSTSETIHEFNSELRTRKLLMFGLTRKSDNILRLDVTIYGGSPRFGLAYARAL